MNQLMAVLAGLAVIASSLLSVLDQRPVFVADALARNCRTLAERTMHMRGICSTIGSLRLDEVGGFCCRVAEEVLPALD